MAIRLNSQWSVAIYTSVEPLTARVPALLLTHIMQLVSESVANAVRHGRAKEVRVGVLAGDECVWLQIDDNGVGMAVHGTFDQDSLARLKIGPRSLRERVVALGGSLSLVSGPDGVRKTVSLPTQAISDALKWDG